MIQISFGSDEVIQTYLLDLKGKKIVGDDAIFFSSGNAELSFEDLPIHLKFSFLQEIFQKFVMVVIFLDSMLVINESNSSLLEIDGMMEKVRKESLVKIISTLGLLG